MDDDRLASIEACETTEPILTRGAKEGVSEGYADVAAGRTMSPDEARDRLCIDD